MTRIEALKRLSQHLFQLSLIDRLICKILSIEKIFFIRHREKKKKLASTQLKHFYVAYIKMFEIFDENEKILNDTSSETEQNRISS